MAGELVTITGVADVERLLSDAPRLLVARGMLKALQAGINVVSDELSIQTPERSEGERSEETVHLRDAMRVSIELDSQLRGGNAGVGFGNLTHVANWVEYGHRMVGHMPGKKLEGQVPPDPFIRPTFDHTADRSAEAFGESIAETIRTEFPQT